MTITPRNISEHVCYKCGTNNCDPENDFEVMEMHRVSEVYGNQYIYNRATVYVPVCRQCVDNKKVVHIFPLVIFAICLLVCLIICSFSQLLPAILLSAVVAVCSWAFSYWGYGIIMSHSNENYGPIAVLMSHGFTFGPEPVKGENGLGQMSNEELQGMIIALTVVNNCEVTA